MQERKHWAVTLGLAGCLLGMAEVGHAFDGYALERFDPRISTRAFGYGALAGVQEDAEAVTGNPANLATSRYMALGMDAGLFPDGSLAGAIRFAQPLPSLGKIGLGFSQIYGLTDTPPATEALDSFFGTEQAIHLAWALSITQGFSVGLKGSLLRATYGQQAAAGESIDLGCRIQAEGFWAAAAAYHLLRPPVGFGLEYLAYPRQAQITLGYKIPKILQVAGECTQNLDDTGKRRIALGLESAFSEDWFVRAGADLENFYSGLGYRNHWWGLDYGFGSDFKMEAMQHRLGLVLIFGTYHVQIVSSSEYLTKNGVNPNVRFTVRYDRAPILKKWAFIIRNEQAVLVKAFAGQNAFSTDVTWEGRDQQSRIVPNGEYSVVLEGLDYDGNWLKSNKVLVKVVDRTAPTFIRVK
jgi:hypothetical protein